MVFLRNLIRFRHDVQVYKTVVEDWLPGMFAEAQIGVTGKSENQNLYYGAGLTGIRSDLVSGIATQPVIGNRKPGQRANGTGKWEME